MFLNPAKRVLGAGGIYSPYSQNAGDKARDILLARWDRGETTREQYKSMIHDSEPKG